MSLRPFNLASRPFRNERLPALLLVLGWLGGLGLTAAHVLAVRRLLPSSTSALHREVASIEARLEQLGQRRATMRGEVDKATLADWARIQELVDRRTLAWTVLLARLEQVLPEGVRITTVAPDVADGRVILALDAVARSGEEAFEFLKRLEDRPEFENVYLLSVSETPQGRELRYRMFYDPPQPRLPAETAGEAGDEEEES